MLHLRRKRGLGVLLCLCLCCRLLGLRYLRLGLSLAASGQQDGDPAKLANALVQLVNPFLFRRIKACVDVPIWASIVKAVAAGGIAWLSQVAVVTVAPGASGVVAVVAVSVGAATYLATWVALSRAELRVDLGILRTLGRPASAVAFGAVSAAEE